MTRSNLPAPAISLEVILPRIIQQCLCEGDACELALDNNFVNARFRAHQIDYLHTFGLNKLHRRLAVKVIACAFDVPPKDVRHALEKGETIPTRRGEHPVLEVDTGQHLIDWITKECPEPYYYQSNRATPLLRRNFWSSGYTGVDRFFFIPT
jgi:hypothetical protein